MAKLAAVFAALLGAGLIDAAVTADRATHGPAFLDRYRGWFFAINIFAGGRSHGGHGGVPMGRGSDEHSINIRSGEDIAEILIGLAGFVAALAIDLGVMIVDAPTGALAPIAPRIANG